MGNGRNKGPIRIVPIVFHHNISKIATCRMNRKIYKHLSNGHRDGQADRQTSKAIDIVKGVQGVIYTPESITFPLPQKHDWHN